MSELAINSERGHQASLDQKWALDFLQARHPDWGYSVSPQDGAGFVDGDFHHLASLEKHRCFECKCRYDMDRETLWGPYGGLWLITYDKLEWLAKMSAGFGVPGYGILYMVSDGTILSRKITDERGKFLFEFKVKKTWTQETCNGGWALRDNAFLPMNGAKELHLEPRDQKILLAFSK